MHHIVGNTNSYQIANWKNDIQMIQAKGVDALALNMGADDWEITQIANAYQAAESLGTGFKLFISFDFTSLNCVLSDLVSIVGPYVNHPNQFKVNGKPMISSYSGECLGNSGWQSLKDQTGGYLMPFIPGLEGNFNQWPALDSWYCWGCAWPQGNYAENTAGDLYYIGQLGAKYATTVSVWMYTHFSYKNWYLRGDDWLINSRWEEIISMRDSLTFVEMVTWNDFGESDYFGPIEGDQPDGTTWATNFPHTAWFDMSQYYITAFKTGTYPAITQDAIYYWARPHPASAIASGDSLPQPTGHDWTEDSMWAAVFATSPASVTLQIGSSSSTFQVTAGVNKLKIPLAVGQMSVKMVRNGQTIIEGASTGYTYINNPVLYNYNAWVGSATSTQVTPGSSSLTSTPSTTAVTAGGVSWDYKGCYQDDPTRIISNGPFTNSSQTIENCQTYCRALGGYLYAGVEYGVQCFCSNSIRTGAIQTAETDCSQTCAGNAGEKCGGGWRINVYQAS